MAAYDLIIIGAGPGGYVAALRAGQLGLRVVCIEKDKPLGGTCLNVGCIPSKALLDSSEHYFALRHGMESHGIKIAGLELDLAAMMARKNKVVKTFTTGINGLFRKNKVERIQGTARLTGPGRVEVSNGAETQQLEARSILLATGSVPVELPGIPFDGVRVISSTEAISLSAVPRRMVVIGGGAIGLELGSVWNRLGAEVEVVEFLDRLVPGMDLQMAGLLQKSLQKQGLKFHLKSAARAVTVGEDGIRVAIEKDGAEVVLECDVVLVAVGRKPYLDGLGLEEIGGKLDQRGRVIVDDHYLTSVAGVYAVGDMIAGPMLAHKAEEEGVAAVEIIAGLAGHVNYETIPGVVYTWPELAGVGKTEEELRAAGVEYRAGSFPFLANGRAKCMDETEGMVKVLADAKTDRILGVHIFGANASDLIAEAAVAMEFGASAEDVARSVHAHPTLPEALKEAAMAVAGRALHI